VYMFTYGALGPVCKILDEDFGWGIQSLFIIPSFETIPFFEPENIKKIIGKIVKKVVELEGWQPTLDIQKAMPCFEDFEPWESNVRKDFIRRWYHTRSKWVKTISLESYKENKGNNPYEVEDPSSFFEKDIAMEDFYQKFKEILSKRDGEILELRMQGFTYERIAEKLGYKTHSGVIKRMEIIKRSFINYEEKEIN
ncbi:MAG: hypothetical protein GX786_10715, partial [Clostridiales bacterium]|nr:hypothetical protein [Clostridiales bacterium]